MSKLSKFLGLGFLTTLLIISCRKLEPVPFQAIDLGNKAQSTAIKSLLQNNTIITAEFNTTVGAKYSVQIIRFGASEPIKTEGFTAKTDITLKQYDIKSLPKGDYDFVLVDISGKEVKVPITIK